MHFYLLGKTNVCHSSSDDDIAVDQDKIQNDKVGCKNDIDILKQESKLSIDGVLEKNLKGGLETRQTEVVEEV